MKPPIHRQRSSRRLYWHLMTSTALGYGTWRPVWAPIASE